MQAPRRAHRHAAVWAPQPMLIGGARAVRRARHSTGAPSASVVAPALLVKGMRKILRNTAILLAAALLVFTVSRTIRCNAATDDLRATDRRIKVEVVKLLGSHLASLPEEHAIVGTFGRFQKLSDVRMTRPSYPWMLVVRLDLTATAHFENARVPLSASIDGVRGGREPTIVRLKSHPESAVVEGHPEWSGTFELVDGELWHVTSSGRSRVTIDAWVNHPDFVAETGRCSDANEDL